MKLGKRLNRHKQVAEQSSDETTRRKEATEGGKLVAKVTSSLGLNQTEKQLVKEVVAKLGAEVVEYRYRVDAHLLGGVRVVVGDWVIDTSLQTQIEKIGARLKG